MRRAGIARRLLFAGVVAVVVLGGAELALRLARGTGLSSRPVGMPEHLAPPPASEPSVGGESPSDAEVFPEGQPPHLRRATRPAERGLPYLLTPGRYGEGCVVNEQLVWGEPVAIPRPPDRIRILTLGGSSTQGWCPTPREDPRLDGAASWPRFLGERLGPIDPGGLTVEVVNAGVDGYRASALVAWYRGFARRVRPDVVLVYSGWNDLLSNPSGANDRLVEGPAGWVTRPAWVLLDHSALALEVRRAVHAFARAGQGRVEEESDARPRDDELADLFPLDFAESIRELVEELRLDGVRPLLLTQVTNLRPGMPRGEIRGAPRWLEDPEGLIALSRVYAETVRGLARELEVDLVDTTGCFPEAERDRLMWDFMHPTSEGYERLGSCLAARLEPLLAEVARERSPD